MRSRRRRSSFRLRTAHDLLRRRRDAVSPLPARVPAGTRALTIKQPWASLIIEGHKDIENRGWFTNHRGLLIIHAGLKVERAELAQHRHLLRNPDELPHGCLLGTVELVDSSKEQTAGGRCGVNTTGCWRIRDLFGRRSRHVGHWVFGSRDV